MSLSRLLSLKRIILDKINLSTTNNLDLLNRKLKIIDKYIDSKMKK